MKFGDKRFYSLNHYFRQTFGEKVIKISLDAGLTCPNRDGTLSYDGCIFCGAGASDHTFSGQSITKQFENYREAVRPKWSNAKYIAYFQAYSNTYGETSFLRDLYYEALSLPGVVGISIATRPDCLGVEVLELLHEISQRTKLFVELGFQSSKPETVKLINRCYENDVFCEAIRNLKNIGANVVSHIILGLPFETEDDMLGSVKFVVNAGIDGIKLHELFVVQNTKLAQMYYDGFFEPLTFDRYIDLAVKALEILPPNIVVHRLTGDAPKELLVAPKHNVPKRIFLNAIDSKLAKNGTFQSKLFCVKKSRKEC